MKLILLALMTNHHSLYLGLIRLFVNHFEQITVVILENSKNHYFEYFNNPKLSIIEEKGATDKIVKKNIKLINEHDVLIMDENYENFIRLAFLSFNVNKFIYIVHNTNKHFQSKFSLNMKMIIKNIFKDIFLKKINAFIVMGPNVKEYLTVCEKHRPVFFFPFDSGNLNNFQGRNDSYINVVIPGTIDSTRRNYKSLMEVLKSYYSYNPNSKIRIYLLGKIVTKTDEYVAVSADEINTQYGQKIKYYRDFVPISEFEETLIQADYILSNIHTYVNYSDRTEIYGTTKESGISFIIYKYEKPAIVPDNQRILSGFNSQLIIYSHFIELYDLFRIIESDKMNYKSLLKEANTNKSNFDKELSIEEKRILKYIAG